MLGSVTFESDLLSHHVTSMKKKIIMLLCYTVRKLTCNSTKSENPFTIPCTYAAYYPHNTRNVLLCLVVLQAFLCFDA